MTGFKLLLLIIVSGSLFLESAKAFTEFNFETEGPQKVEQDQSWSSYGEYIDNFGLTTYAQSKPTSSTQLKERRQDEIYIEVEQVLNDYPVVVISMGVNIDEHLPAYALIDGRRYPLYVDESLQHLYVDYGVTSDGNDSKFIEALKQGLILEIHASTYEKSKIKDTYSLMGATAMIENSEALINSLSELMPAYLN